MPKVETQTLFYQQNSPIRNRAANLFTQFTDKKIGNNWLKIKNLNKKNSTKARTNTIFIKLFYIKAGVFLTFGYNQDIIITCRYKNKVIVTFHRCF